jgi:ABC-type transporter Mla subunit MlaD
MDPRFFRKYANIVEAAERDQSVQQLDEGMMDMLKPLAQKLGKWIVRKLDPQTAQQIAQAAKQANGDNNKFMAALGISKQDIQNLAQKIQPEKSGVQQQPAMNEWLSAGEDPNAPLKVKVLNLVANGLPLAGILHSMAVGALGGAGAISWTVAIWWVVSWSLMWGIGSYEFSDAFKDTSPDQPRAPVRMMPGSRDS